MINYGKFSRMVVYLICICLLPGCQSGNSAMLDIGDYSPETIMNRVQVGDTINVETADGSSHRFEVTAMDETTLSSRDAVYEYSEIQRLQIQQRNRDSSEALGVVGAVLLVILGIVLIAAGSSSGSSMSGLEGGLFQ